MPLAEKTEESEEKLYCKETFSIASGTAKDGGGHLDAIKVQIVSADVNSNVRLDENERESKQIVFCGKTTRDQAVKMECQEWTCSVCLVSPENEEDGNISKGDKSHDSEVSPKELSYFEQQIGLEMVSGFCLFVRVTTTATLAISSHTLVDLSLKHLAYTYNMSNIARKDQLNVWTNIVLLFLACA